MASVAGSPLSFLVQGRRGSLKCATLHAKNLDVAQTILGPACAEIGFSNFRDSPLIDDREFFVSACCWHPSFIHAEQIVFILDSRVRSVVVDDHLPGLRYLVRACLVAYQDWSTPPASPKPNGGIDGRDGQGDEDGGGRASDDGAEAGDGEVDDGLPVGQQRDISGPSGPSHVQANATQVKSIVVGVIDCPCRLLLPILVTMLWQWAHWMWGFPPLVEDRWIPWSPPHTPSSRVCVWPTLAR